jgi:hypothetical protein
MNAARSGIATDRLMHQSQTPVAHRRVPIFIGIKQPKTNGPWL